MFPQQAASSKITPRMISSLGPAPSAVPLLILLPPAVFYVRSYFLVRLNRLVEHCPPAALSTKSADYFLFSSLFPSLIVLILQESRNHYREHRYCAGEASCWIHCKLSSSSMIL